MLAHKFAIYNLLYFSWFLVTITQLYLLTYLLTYLELIYVQVADLSHENFKSGRVMRWWLSRLSSRFGAKSSREREPKWLRSSHAYDRFLDMTAVSLV